MPSVAARGTWKEGPGHVACVLARGVHECQCWPKPTQHLFIFPSILEAIYLKLKLPRGLVRYSAISVYFTIYMKKIVISRCVEFLIFQDLDLSVLVADVRHFCQPLQTPACFLPSVCVWSRRAGQPQLLGKKGSFSSQQMSHYSKRGRFITEGHKKKKYKQHKYKGVLTVCRIDCFIRGNCVLWYIPHVVLVSSCSGL